MHISMSKPSQIANIFVSVLNYLHLFRKALIRVPQLGKDDVTSSLIIRVSLPGKSQ